MYYSVAMDYVNMWSDQLQWIIEDYILWWFKTTCMTMHCAHINLWNIPNTKQYNMCKIAILVMNYFCVFMHVVMTCESPFNWPNCFVTIKLENLFWHKWTTVCVPFSSCSCFIDIGFEISCIPKLDSSYPVTWNK